MTEITLIPSPDDWRPACRQRRIDAYRAVGVPAPAAEKMAEDVLERVTEWTAAAIADEDGRRVGQVVVGVTDRDGTVSGRIGELWTDPAHDERGVHRQAAHAWARQWCVGRGVREVGVWLAVPDEFFDGYQPRAQNRFKVITTPAPLPGAVTARPMRADEFPGWQAAGVDRYAADIVRSGTLTPQAAREKAGKDYRRLLPAGLDSPDTSLWILEAEGREIGAGWLKHRYLPGVTFGYSLVIHPEYRGRGHGHSAMALGEQATVAAGDQALMFNVFGGNTVAMSLYTAAGYRVLDETRSEDPAQEADSVPETDPVQESEG